MARLIVTRHAGAREWLRRRGVTGQHYDALDPTAVAAGDEVYGVLPIPLAAAIAARGARYFHIVLPNSETWRGQELDADEMERIGARLVAFRVERDSFARLSGRELLPSLLERLSAIEDRFGAVMLMAYTTIVVVLAPAGAAAAYADLAKASHAVAVTACLGGALWMAATYLAFLAAKGERNAVIAEMEAQSARLRGRRSPLAPVPIAAALVAASGGTALNGLADTFEGGGDAWPLTFWMLVFLAAATGALRLGKSLFHLDVEQRPAGQQRPRRAIVMALSHLPDRPGGSTLDLEAELAKPDPHPTARQVALALDPGAGLTLEAACEPEAFGSPQFPWQQNLRVIAANFGVGAGRLRKGELVVIPSEQSAMQFDVFARLVACVAKRSGVELTIRRRGPADFFWLTDIEQELRAAVAELTERPIDRLSHRDVVIDVTAGSKLPSIAAAVTTMTNEMTFAYAEGRQVWQLNARARIGRNS